MANKTTQTGTTRTTRTTTAAAATTDEDNECQVDNNDDVVVVVVNDAEEDKQGSSCSGEVNNRFDEDIKSCGSGDFDNFCDNVLDCRHHHHHRQSGGSYKEEDVVELDDDSYDVLGEHHALANKDRTIVCLVNSFINSVLLTLT